MNRRQKQLRNRRMGKNRAPVKVAWHVRLVRIGRDGKNRYCLYHYEFTPTPIRVVVAGGLTKLAAWALLKLMKEQ